MLYLEFLKEHLIHNITKEIMGLLDAYSLSIPPEHLVGGWIQHDVQQPKWVQDLFHQAPEELEVEEFWVVSPKLAEALLKEGEFLTNEFGFWVWGRDAWSDWSLPREEKRKKWRNEAEGWIPWDLRKPYQLESVVLNKIWLKTK